MTLLTVAAVIVGLAVYLARRGPAPERRALGRLLTHRGVSLPPGSVETAVPKPPPPKVDVVFVLDTTGSMGALLEGAKQHIWAIANRLASGQPSPDVRIGLVAYRDQGDAYVTRRHDLASNMDDVHANLAAFRAEGGGDTPEHVNQALKVAIDDMSWRRDRRTLRLVFLVGDAPPHEGRDGLRSFDLARRASARGIVINAVRCGSLAGTAAAWRRIARAAGGMYASIRQDGGMLAISTPHDARLAELNRRLSATLLPSGGSALRLATRRRAARNSAMDAKQQAWSAAYRARTGKIDTGDLLSQMKKGRRLGSYKEAELPAKVAALPKPARRAYVAKVVARRAKLKAEILRLDKRRGAYLRGARRRAGVKGGFDDAIGSALKAQGGRVGIRY